MPALFFAFVLLCIAVNAPAEAAAQTAAEVAAEAAARLPPLPEAIIARSAVLTSAATGDILFAKNPDEPIPPASLAKLMTIHVAQRLAALEGASLDEPVPLPPASWAVNQPPRSSLMFLAPGQIVSLRELFLGLAVPSGNDAAVAVALRFAVTVEQFAAAMNNEAARMGLRKTRFVEPSGIDENNITTAAEFAAFCRVYLSEHPENLAEYHTVTEFAYPKPSNLTGAQQNHPGTITQGNHISILSTYTGADGLKTGYIDEAGYNLAATAERGGERYIAVVLGVPADLGPRWGDRARTEDAQKLLDYGFDSYKTLRVEIPALQAAKVWKGRKNRLTVHPAPHTRAGGNVVVVSPAPGNAAYPAGAAAYPAAGAAAAAKNAANAASTLILTVPAGRGEGVVIETAYTAGICAPFPAGAAAGTLTLFDNDGEIAVINLQGDTPVERAGGFKRFFHAIAMFIRGIKPAL